MAKTTLAAPAEHSAEWSPILQELESLRRKVAERAEFVEDLAHELRSGLTFLRGYVDLFLAGTLGPISDKQRHALEVMARRTDAVLHLLDQMLSLERARAGHLELSPAVDIAEVVQHSVQSMRVAADQAGVQIEVQCPPCLLVEGDARRLLQVVDNLLSNAIKFSYPGIKVRIAVSDDGDEVGISVADEGVGIAPEEQQRIFERFYRSPRGSGKADGTGLGLVIVRAIVEAHGGRIWVESELGKGSTFHIALPKRQERARSAP